MRTIISITILAVSLLSCMNSEENHTVNDHLEVSNSNDVSIPDSAHNEPIELSDTLSIDSIIVNDLAEVEAFNNLSINIQPYTYMYLKQIVTHQWKNQRIRMTAQIQHGGPSSSTAGMETHTWYFKDGEVFQSSVVDRRKSGDIHIYEITHASDIDFRDPPMTHSVNGKRQYHHMDTWESKYNMNLRCLKNALDYVSEQK